MKKQIKQFLIGTMLTCCMPPLVLSAAYAQSSPQTHVLNLKDADIRAFIEDISVTTGKTFIVDPRVTGTVTVSSRDKLSKTEIFRVFQDVLRVRGFTAVPTQTGAYRITLIQGASQDAPMAKDTGWAGTMSTVVVRLTHENSQNAMTLIKPVLHSQGRVSGSPGGKVLVITDYPENIAKARNIIEAMDIDKATVTTIVLRHIRAKEAEATIKALIGTGAPKVRNNVVIGETVKAVSVEATNTIILRGEASAVEQLRRMLLQIDRPSAEPRGKISVISLQNADGEEIVKVLEKMLPSLSGISVNGRRGNTAARGVGRNVAPMITYEPGSKSVVISADPDTRTALEEVVRALDVRRAQVLVEALIVEISDTAAKDLGFQFTLAGNENSTIPFFATNFSRSAPNLLAITGALAGDSAFDSVALGGLQDAAVDALTGLTGGTLGVGGSGGDGLFGAVLNAVQNDSDSNILSTPFVTTLDNMPATFLAGQDVPFVSGEALGSNNQNPFRTVSREEIGIKLEVLPQITEGDSVRLEITQEVSSIATDASTIAAGLVTNKREITTTVLADNREMIVLGGLVQDDEQLFKSQVPVLGDIPVLGELFKGRNDSRKRTNLMVFIRPTIIRSSEDAVPLTQRKLDIIRAEEFRRFGETRRIDKALEQIGK